MIKRFILAAAIAGLTVAPVAAAPPALTLKVSPAVVTFGTTATLSGVLSTQRSGQSVDIQAQTCGQNAFKRIASVTTTSGGAFTYAANSTILTSYQAKQKGATSSAVPVKVAPQLALTKRAGGSPSRRFVAALTSAQSFVGKYVVFQKRTSAGWKTVKKVTFTSVKTTAPSTQVTSQNFAVRIKGHPKVRLLLPAAQAGACYVPAVSKAIRS